MGFQHDNDQRTLEQFLDARCFVEGERYEIRAKFKLLDSDLATPATCNPSVRKLSRSDHSPTIRLVLEDCDVPSMYPVLWNQNEADWVPDDFNEYLHEFTISAEYASCKKIHLELGRKLPLSKALVIDNVEINLIEYNPTTSPTKSPTESPTESPSTLPANSPTESPTKSPTKSPTESPTKSPTHFP